MLVSFGNPKYLFLLAAVPLLILIHFYSLKKHKKRALQFANFDAISRITGAQFFSKNLTVLYLGIIFVLLLTFAASGMRVQVTKKASSFSFVIAIDSSYSMETSDIAPDRITAAKKASKEFVDASPLGTKIGVISFSGVPYVEHDLTSDKDPLKSAIDRIQVNRVGGTNILNALITSAHVLADEGSKSVIFVSDGQISVDTVEDIIKYANQEKIVLSTIGIGTKEGAETDIGFISKIDEDALKAMAYETGGYSFFVDNQEDFDKSLKEVLKITRRKVILEVKSLLILFSVIVFLLIFFLSNTRYRGVP